MNEDDSQIDLHPEAGIFNNQMTQNSSREDRHDISVASSVVSKLSYVRFSLTWITFLGQTQKLYAFPAVEEDDNLNL